MDDALDRLFGDKSPVRRFKDLTDMAPGEEGGDVQHDAILTAKMVLLKLKENDATVGRPAIAPTHIGGVSLFWRNGVNVTIDFDGKTVTAYRPHDLDVTADISSLDMRVILTALRTPYSP